MPLSRLLPALVAAIAVLATVAALQFTGSTTATGERMVIESNQETYEALEPSQWDRIFRADGPPVLVEYHCEYGEFVDSLIEAEPIAHGLKPGDPLPPKLFEPISPRWRDADFEVRSVLETQIILFAQQPDPNDPSRRELRIRVGYYRAQSGRLF